MEKLVLDYNSIVRVMSLGYLNPVSLLDLRFSLSVIKSDLDGLGVILEFDDAGYIVGYDEGYVESCDDSLGFVNSYFSRLLGMFNLVDINGFPDKWKIVSYVRGIGLNDEYLDLLDSGLIPYELYYKFRRRESLFMRHGNSRSYGANHKFKRKRIGVTRERVDISSYVD